MMYLNILLNEKDEINKECLTVTYDVFKSVPICKFGVAPVCLTVTYDVFKYFILWHLPVFASSLTVTYDVFKLR